VYGVTQRVLRLIFGNPIIAFTMMRDDLIAAEDPAPLPAARALDNRLNALISGATGVPMPARKE